MTRKRRRLYLLGLMLGGLSVATALVLSAFRDSIVFFYSPSEIVEKQVPPDRPMRIGGLVEVGSLQRAQDSLEIRFRVTDLNHAVPVIYAGVLPDLFREGHLFQQGVGFLRGGRSRCGGGQTCGGLDRQPAGQQ